MRSWARAAPCAAAPAAPAAPCVAARRARPRAGAARPCLAIEDDDEYGPGPPGIDPLAVVQPAPARRATAPAPRPAPIERSSAYLLRRRAEAEAAAGGDAPPAPPARVAPPPPGVTGGALEWALRRADASLDEIEADPPGYARALHALSSGPVGAAASKATVAAARLAARAGSEAAKAAVPAGKWVLATGFKVALGAAAAGLRGGAKKKKAKDEG